MVREGLFSGVSVSSFEAIQDETHDWSAFERRISESKASHGRCAGGRLLAYQGSTVDVTRERRAVRLRHGVASLLVSPEKIPSWRYH